MQRPGSLLLGIGLEVVEERQLAAFSVALSSFKVSFIKITDFKKNPTYVSAQQGEPEQRLINQAQLEEYP